MILSFVRTLFSRQSVVLRHVVIFKMVGSHTRDARQLCLIPSNNKREDKSFFIVFTKRFYFFLNSLVMIEIGIKI